MDISDKSLIFASSKRNNNNNIKSIGEKNMEQQKTKAFGNVTCNIETITPSMAKSYLDNNTRNRKINNSTVKRYAVDMKSGNWKLNGETIIFDSDNVLKQGQHRLLACIKADTPFETVVVRGVDVDTFDTIDTGHGRNMSDMFSAANIHDATELMQIISKYYGLKSSKGALSAKGDTNITARGKYGNKNILGRETYLADKEYYDNIVAWMKNIKKNHKAMINSLRLSAGDIGGCVVFLNKDKGHDIEKCKAFFEELCLINIEESHCYITSLRDVLLKNNMAVTRMTPKAMQSYIAKAWNMYVGAAKVAKKLHCSNEEVEQGIEFA